MDQLRRELEILGSADLDLLRNFHEYLDSMDGAVEEIWSALAENRVEDAILLKRDFEAQISPSFKRSKQMFERMGQAVRGVQAA
jgi:hypothetical protein